MSAEVPDRISRLVAEEVLTLIFGEDLAGCTVSLDDVARVIQRTVNERAEQDARLIETYNTVIASIHELATPPASAKDASPDQLRSILGERLDAVSIITTKTLEMCSRIQRERRGPDEPIA